VTTGSARIGAIGPTERRMERWLKFRPYPLEARRTISLPGARYEVVLLRFRGLLGLTQPTTHVKVRVPDTWLPLARTYSVVSPADADGYFEIAVKVLPGGRASPFLQALPLGANGLFARTHTKQLLAPLDVPGRHLALVAFGIGVTECVLTARRAAAAGQHVGLVYALATSLDAVYLEELAALAAEYPPGADAAGQGSFALTVLVSREEPADVLRTLVAKAVESGRGPAAALHLRRGRVDTASLADAFGAPAWRDATRAGYCAVMVVGNRSQRRSTSAQLSALGLSQPLLGAPILWES